MITDKKDFQQDENWQREVAEIKSRMAAVFYTNPELYQKIQEEEYIPLIRGWRKPKVSYEKINQPIYTNQTVIEIQRNGKTTPEENQGDFLACQNARDLLYKRKESLVTLSLHEYLARDRTGFRRVLYSSAFCEQFGLSRISFQRAFDALIFDTILKPTLRKALGTNGVIGDIFIFDKGVPENIPSETYNYKNKEHNEKVKQMKTRLLEIS